MPVMDTTRTNKAGMSRQRLIQLADERTGKISHGKLNLDAEFVTVLQDFCSAYRWYWRRKTVGFDTTVNEPSYGLAVSDNSIPAVDCEQIIRAIVFGVPGVSDAQPYKKLTPLFDPEMQEVALWDTTQGPPTNYFIEPGTSNVLRLTPIPDAVYPVRVAYWAMPNLAFDDLVNQIPLVPGYLHHLLVKGLEAQIFRYAIGQASGAYLAAKAEYESGRDDAAMRRDFTVEKGREWSSQDEAIRG